MINWTHSDALISSVKLCDECNCDLSNSDNPPAEVTVNTRYGTMFSQHFSKVCPNRWCRKRFMYGYSIKDGIKVYDKINENTKYLITSSETAFSIAYLYEATLHFLHSNTTFMALADIYNQFHNYLREDIIRKNLCHKRLASGFFLYSFLEMSCRYNICPTFGSGQNWIDEGILKCQTLLRKEFSKNWTKKT